MRRYLTGTIAFHALGCLVVTPLDGVVPRREVGDDATIRSPDADHGAEPLSGYECVDPIAQWRADPPYMAIYERKTGDCPNLATSADPLNVDPECETTFEQVSSGCGYTWRERCEGEGGVTAQGTIALEQTTAGGPIGGTLDLQLTASDGSCASSYAVTLAARPMPYVCDPLLEFSGRFRTAVVVLDNGCDLSVPPGGERMEDWQASSWLGAECPLAESFTEPFDCSYFAAFDCSDGGGATVVVSQEVPGGPITADWIEDYADGCVLQYLVHYLPL